MVPRNNFYAKWRAQNQSRLFLREPDEPNPRERLVQSIWHHQRILRDQLRTLDGRAVRVLHPGFWNHGSGPDFKSAVIQFEGERPKSGDVEIDLVPAGWRGHGHDRNAAFGNVILHVVWNKTESSTALNTLALEPFLDAPLAELTSAIGGETGQRWPDELRGKCCAPLNELPADRIVDLLQQAAWIRLQRKASELEARARQAGWEQALWEGLFRGLGYKQNVWPMQRLAEILPRTTDREASTLALQARFFGSAGLLPDDVANERSQPYLRSLWDIWWRERENFSDVALPPTLWRFTAFAPPINRNADSRWLLIGSARQNFCNASNNGSLMTAKTSQQSIRSWNVFSPTATNSGPGTGACVRLACPNRNHYLVQVA